MQQPKIIRDYRQMARLPARFMAFCKKLVHSLTDNPYMTEAELALLKEFFEKVILLESAYHRALDRAKSVIRERDKLIQEIVALLDKLASVLESEFGRNSDALLSTGFTITQERRATPRVRIPQDASDDFMVFTMGGRKVLAKASTVPGGIIQEIQINLRDPAAEGEWFHKGFFHYCKDMMMQNFELGNTFFRMRHLGHDGAGPWSEVVSITIT